MIIIIKIFNQGCRVNDGNPTQSGNEFTVYEDTPICLIKLCDE